MHTATATWSIVSHGVYKSQGTCVLFGWHKARWLMDWVAGDLCHLQWGSCWQEGCHVRISLKDSNVTVSRAECRFLCCLRETFAILGRSETHPPRIPIFRGLPILSILLRRNLHDLDQMFWDFVVVRRVCNSSELADASFFWPHVSFCCWVFSGWFSVTFVVVWQLQVLIWLVVICLFCRTNISGRQKCFRQILPTASWSIHHVSTTHPHVWCGFLFFLSIVWDYTSRARNRSCFGILTSPTFISPLRLTQFVLMSLPFCTQLGSASAIFTFCCVYSFSQRYFFLVCWCGQVQSEFLSCSIESKFSHLWTKLNVSTLKANKIWYRWAHFFPFSVFCSKSSCQASKCEKGNIFFSGSTDVFCSQSRGRMGRDLLYQVPAKHYPTRGTGTQPLQSCFFLHHCMK